MIDWISPPLIVGKMKRQLFSKALTLGIAAGALLFTSCSTPESRVSKHPEIYHSLSSRNQALVSQGQIRGDMKTDAVWLAWGSPDRKIVGNMRGHSTETWIYVRYESYPYYPYGYPYYGPFGPGLAYDFGAVRVVGRHHRYGGRSFVFFGDPVYDPFYYSYIPPSIPYLYKTVTFSNGRVVSFQYLEPPSL
jgi:hypothetical protein